MTSKYMAGLSLTLMALGFLATLLLPEAPLWLVIRGGFEAGLVGGIADWFAVTALFRHPFGVPIPHTSLLLRNRDKITQALISTMENELLNKESIEEKLRELRLLESAGAFAASLLRKRSIRVQVMDALIRMVRTFPSDKALPLLKPVLSGVMKGMDVQAAASQLLSGAVRSGYDRKLFDLALAEALVWVKRPDTRILLGRLANEKMSGVRVGGFMGFAFQAFTGFMEEERLGQLLQDMLASTIRELADPGHPMRETMLKSLNGQMARLAEDGEQLEVVKERILNRLLDGRGDDFLTLRFEELRRYAVDKLEQERAAGAPTVFAVYAAAVRYIRKDGERLELAEKRLLEHVIRLVEANHYRIGRLVKENVDRMEDAVLIGMLEDKLGKDLQWIRVNGAICGFAVGIVLSLLQL